MIRFLLLSFVLVCSFSASAAPNILVLGDSISAGLGLHQNQGWVSLLQQRLISKDYPHKVINASISGETSSGGLRRISSVLDKHNPKVVIIELGANDGLRGLKLSQLRSNLSDITDLSLRRQAKVLLLGMQLPPNYGPAYTKAFSNVFIEVSKDKQVSIVPFLFSGFESDLQYFQADQIHPNAQAQTLMLDNIWPTLSRLIKIH